MKIYIKTPSRLHFGIVDLSGALGRNYGSVGLAIDEPSYEILMEKSGKLEIIGEDRERAKEIILRIAKLLDLPTNVNVRLLQSIPKHMGLGSTTQLSLALGKALAELNGMKISTLEIAQKIGRGKQSGVGTYAFETGGFIVDGGKKGEGFPPLILRRDFPTGWRFVIAIPEVERGLSEEAEEKIFMQAKSSSKIAREICHLLVMKMLPSMVERDIEDFGWALTQMDRLVGEAFSPHQKGIFHSEIVSEIINHMFKKGAYGAGQSSWGPAIYGLVEDEVQGRKLEKSMKRFLEKKRQRGFVRMVRANNLGATIRIDESRGSS